MRILTAVWFWIACTGALAAQDTGKEPVARLRTVLLLGSDGNLGEVVPDAKEADKEHAKRMELLKDLNFNGYALLGTDIKPVLRSYTNWASPMKGADEILLSFEPHNAAEAEGVELDLALWQGKRKVMKTTHPFKYGKWLYIAGPKWRGGRLIVGVELLALEEK